MAGHSKWANIQHRKGAQDRKRGRMFTKLLREIASAARVGGADPAGNPRLRLAVEKARAASMARDTIERAIRRGAGESGGENFEAVRYEGYGPGGAAILVDCLTDNRNRTVSEIRHVFSRYGGNLGATGSVAYLFDQVGVLSYPPGTAEDALLEAALNAGAEDVRANEDGSIDVLTAPDEYEAVCNRLRAAGFETDQGEVTLRASTSAPLAGDAADTMARLLDTLEDLDDVQHVYSNAELPEDVLAQA